MYKKIKVLFIYRSLQTFVKKDLEMLKKHFDVKVIHYLGPKSLPIIWFKILKGTLWADITFSWFANIHAFLAVAFSKMLEKKSIVVTGGYDVVKMPEINYGLMSAHIANFLPRWSFNLADRVLPISNSAKSEVLRHSRTNSTKIRIVYLGLDCERYKSKGKKEVDLVITVGRLTNSNLKRKGLETFVKSAKFLPRTRFVLIGEHTDNSVDYLKSIVSPNVQFTNFVTCAQLLNYFQKAKVYVQVSAHEGFGLSLAEAMLCGCVPVVSRRGAIPEVVANTGFYVPYGNPEATAKAIKKALKSDKGEEARKRIQNTFPQEQREKELVQIIKDVLRKSESDWV